MIFVPLLDQRARHRPAASTTARFRRCSRRRSARHYERAKARQAAQSSESPNIRIHVIGFAKLIGELIDGLVQVMVFFGVAALIATGDHLRLHALRAQHGAGGRLLAGRRGLAARASSRSLGFELDPFSILVPFLVFAIGVSHGAQKMNGIMQDIGRGTHQLVAARYTFRRLFLAGLTALLADAVGFAVLMVIDIPVIKELALTASIGVAVLIFTNLLLLPVLLSYHRRERRHAAERSLRESEGGRQRQGHRPRLAAARPLHRRGAGRSPPIGVSARARRSAASSASLHLKIGDLDPGAPELRRDSRYNRDNAYITANYALSTDQFAVIVKTAKEGCLKYETLVEADRLAWALQQVPGVQTTVSLADAVRQITAGSFEGNPKWLTINRNQDVLNYARAAGIGEQSRTCSTPSAR